MGDRQQAADNEFSPSAVAPTPTYTVPSQAAERGPIAYLAIAPSISPTLYPTTTKSDENISEQFSLDDDDFAINDEQQQPEQEQQPEQPQEADDTLYSEDDDDFVHDNDIATPPPTTALDNENNGDEAMFQIKAQLLSAAVVLASICIVAILILSIHRIQKRRARRRSARRGLRNDAEFQNIAAIHMSRGDLGSYS